MVAIKSSPIVPLFAPLRIDYSWVGSFQYDRRQKGHSWTFANKDKWRRISLEVTGDDVPSKGGELALKESARRYGGEAKASFLACARDVSKKNVEMSEWQLITWLRDDSAGDRPGSANVGRAVSLVLNALVRQSTLKPFELIATFVDQHISVEVRQLGPRVPSWFYLQAMPFEDLDEYLVCFPELFLQNGTEQLQTGVRNTLKQLLHVRCKHNYSVLAVEQDNERVAVTLRDAATIMQYPKGAVCNCISVPGKRRKKPRIEPAGVNTPEVVLSSRVVSEALTELSRIWQDPHAKSVLISSPPGSGKEVFANSIPVGNGRSIEDVQSLSMASGDQEALIKQLNGFLRPDGSIEPGLIAKAEGAALFLDEVHQPDGVPISVARANLLRTLESDVYFPVGSNQEQRIENVLWVMATSKTIEELGELRPIDFWTRMTHALRIPHPLDYKSAESPAPSGRVRFPLAGFLAGAGDGGVIHTIIADFFRSFWWDLCDRQYGIDPIADPNELSPQMIPQYWQQRSMLEVIVSDGGDKIRGGCAADFSDTFLKMLRRHKMKAHEFSIRGIRNIVARVFAIAWSNVAQGRKPWSDENFTAHVERIFTELRNVARLT